MTQVLYERLAYFFVFFVSQLPLEFGGGVGKFQLNLQLNATLNMWLIRNFSIANNQPPNPDSLVDFFNLEQTETSIRRCYIEILMVPL